MKIHVRGIELPLGKDQSSLEKVVSRTLQLRIESIAGIKILRRSLDARKSRGKPVWHYALEVETSDRPTRCPSGVRWDAAQDNDLHSESRDDRLNGVSAVIAGSGPAGLFTALALLLHGALVTILEQGPELKDRVTATRRFWREGRIDPMANVQFGEGGAGTFSDGKLTFRNKSPLARRVLETFVKAGAPPVILEEAHPHIGTDGVRRVVSSLRKQIEGEGGKFRFGEKVVSLRPKEAGGCTVVTPRSEIEADLCFLAVGHSSRSLARRVVSMGLPAEAKGFAVGVRVEHPQAWVDECQYGRYAGHPNLPPAEYRLTFKDRESGRGVYSFCMCPGGLVVNSASGEGRLVTNGMSMSHRASGKANSGIVVTVSPDDFNGDPLSAMAFQENLEAAAFRLGGGDHFAPAQSVRAYLDGRVDEETPSTSFRPGVRSANLRGLFPDWIEAPLLRALLHFESRMPGFIENGVLVAPETRTSSPLRFLRDEAGSSPGFPWLYIPGEAGGWSGGIVSSAVDGLRCVERIVGKKRGFAPAG